MDASRFWAKVAKSDGCWLWTGSTVPSRARVPLLYGQMKWRGKNTLAHRVSWEVEYGVAPGDACVLHRCDNPKCVRPDHLFLGTIGDNNRDKLSKGRGGHLSGADHPLARRPERRPRGERHGNAKLTDAAVRQAREWYAQGVSYSEIARTFGVNRTTISRAISGDVWRHVA